MNHRINENNIFDFSNNLNSSHEKPIVVSIPVSTSLARLRKKSAKSLRRIIVNQGSVLFQFFYFFFAPMNLDLQNDNSIGRRKRR